MNRYAANRVVVGPKVFLPGVVEVCNESVTAYYQLTEELAKTKWLVGTIHVIQGRYINWREPAFSSVVCK